MSQSHTQTRRDRLWKRRELQRRRREALPTIAAVCFVLGIAAGYGWRSMAYGDINTKQTQHRTHSVTVVGY